MRSSADTGSKQDATARRPRRLAIEQEGEEQEGNWPPLSSTPSLQFLLREGHRYRLEREQVNQTSTATIPYLDLTRLLNDQSSSSLLGERPPSLRSLSDDSFTSNGTTTGRTRPGSLQGSWRENSWANLDSSLSLLPLSIQEDGPEEENEENEQTDDSAEPPDDEDRREMRNNKTQ